MPRFGQNVPAFSAAAPPGPSKTSVLAIVSVVLGVLSCPLSCLTAIPGLICGIISLLRIGNSEKTQGPKLAGRGLAVTGIIINAGFLIITPVLIGLLLPAVQSAREAARRMGCQNNLKNIGLAILNFETVHRGLPTAIVDANGEPLLSWRVAILPFLEEQALYDEFHLNEPWDSPHNVLLVDRMPAVFSCPSSVADPGLTTYMGAAGEGMVLHGADRKVAVSSGGEVAVVPLQSVADGISKTAIVIETCRQSAAPWTKPVDIIADPEEAIVFLQAGSEHAGDLHMALFIDGSVRAIAADVNPSIFEAILTKNGGEEVPSDF